jgi:drug/metabolite transporter (DMT)-like permease
MTLAAAHAVQATRAATLLGGVAVLLWSSFALLTALAGPVPPLQLLAMTFTLAFALALAKWLWRGESVRAHLRLPAPVWAVGVGGMFGFHFLYFVALQNAPPVEASLINYLWPLLIVLFSALPPGERLRWFHLAGALAGLAGTALLVGGGRLGFQAEYVLGYAAALGCAFCWSGYSVLSRRFRAVPTDAVGAYCGATALLAWALHPLFEATRWPAGGREWLIVLAMGLGPAGAAFYLWDRGCKRGDIRALGAAAYGAPLVSTLLLIGFGLGEPRWSVLAACLLIAGGAALGAGDLMRRR